jgi:hypothetical protein
MTKRRKYENGDAIKNAAPLDLDAYITWGDDLESKQIALKRASSSLEEFTGIQKAEAAGRRYSLDYSNLDTNTSGRPGFTRTDYDFFRPDEAIPRRSMQLILRKAEDIYKRNGLVKNVIDLMGDFACQGIKLVHKNKKYERFYRRWFEKVGGKERSERFLNNLYKSGNIVINRQTGKLPLKSVSDMYKVRASADFDITDANGPEVGKREIPWRYTFIDPVLVEVAGGSLSSFIQDKRYQIILPASIRKIINSPKSEEERQLVANLPAAIIEAAKQKKAYPLDPAKTEVFHYKKDDWEAWAYPMIHAIMDDITLIDKLKLADMAALDGAISNIRIFKLGSLEHKIAPTKNSTAKLAQILGNNVGGGTMDLIWGPDIELIESKTSVHQFLGEGKYIPHLNSIYAGLGIPPTLTGTFGAAGTTNNFISLKTLTQRLEYGRAILTRFWKHEIELVQKAMGFPYPADIEFDRMDLSNEESEKALLIQLVDRNLISDELLQTKFGMNPDMEKARLNRERKERDSERRVRKAGPWYDPVFENTLKKIALQLGIVSPGQVGLELEKKKSGEKIGLELKSDFAPTPTKLANDSSSKSLPKESGEGRPKLSKDTQKRKEKVFRPRTGAKLMMWAAKAQDQISDIVNPMFLEYVSKKNLRMLSNAESQELEHTKSLLLLRLKPYQHISESLLSNLIDQNDLNKGIIQQYSTWSKVLRSELGRELNSDETKQAKASFYSMVYESNDNITN